MWMSIIAVCVWSVCDAEEISFPFEEQQSHKYYNWIFISLADIVTWFSGTSSSISRYLFYLDYFI